jgi:N-acetylmuramoyl-L-alanine amidase CwlA
MAEKGKKSKRRKIKQRRIAIGLLVVIALIIFIVWGYERKKNLKVKTVSADDVTAEKYIEERPELDVELLPVNSYSRPGTALEEVRGIVIHYTANPGSTARQNRDYFAGLAESHETSASSHFVIGLQGEIVQCIPCNEIAYASNERNGDTIAIECCIEDESGKFNSDTYRSLVELTSWLIGRYDLCVEDVIRHYDVTGKNCPKYFVEHENAWEDFKNDIISYIDENGVEKVE